MPGRITDTQLEEKNTHIPKEWPWELQEMTCQASEERCLGVAAS